MPAYLWQNFLIDSKVRQYIADKVAELYNKWGCDALVEIWPWKWSITKKIWNVSPNFFIIEKDDTLKSKVEEILSNLDSNINHQLIMKDVLKVDLELVLKEREISTKKTLVIWNLPYYITSPIFRKFFGYGHQDFAGWVFMIQDEVGQKIWTQADKKSYLRWLVNYAYTVDYLKWVPAKAFKPVPKVKSCLVWFKIKEDIPNIKFEELVKFLDLFAPYSRKTLWRIFKMNQKKGNSDFTIPSDLLSKRLEELSWADLESIIV